MSRNASHYLLWQLLLSKLVSSFIYGEGFHLASVKKHLYEKRHPLCRIRSDMQYLASSVNSISIAGPLRALVEEVPTKLRYVAAVLPRPLHMNASFYAFENETLYYESYRASVYCLTSKKGGWSTMRHYEILANGCIPYIDQTGLPPCVIPEFPRKLAAAGRALAIYNSSTIASLAKEGDEALDIGEFVLPPELHQVALALLHHAREQMTSKGMASKFLSVITSGHQGLLNPWATLRVARPQNLRQDCNATRSGAFECLAKRSVARVFFLNQYEIIPRSCSVHGLAPDYTRDMLLVGLRELGLLVIDVPRLDWLYDDFPPEKDGTIYGRGFSYVRILRDEVPGYDMAALRGQWRVLLRNHFFDHVVLTTQGGAFPYTWPRLCDRPPGGNLLKEVVLDMKRAQYSPLDMSFVHGCDWPMPGFFYERLPHFLQRSHIFLREGINWTKVWS